MLKIDNKKCWGCKDCISVCSQNAIYYIDKSFYIDHFCNNCNKCIDKCAFEAITSSTSPVTVTNVDKISIDKPILQNIKNIPEILLPHVDALGTALVAAAAVGPLGVIGAVDTVAIGGIWSALFFAIYSKSNQKNLNVPSVVKAIVGGFVQYIIGCKVATSLVSLIPGAGIFIGISASTIVNVYFTYRFALISAEVLNDEDAYTLNDTELISRVLKKLCQFPSFSEIKAVWAIYKQFKI
jgi:NAD-dependent dihydropyrimidine dehydrogenase PreA subunit